MKPGDEMKGKNKGKKMKTETEEPGAINDLTIFRQAAGAKSLNRSFLLLVFWIAGSAGCVGSLKKTNHGHHGAKNAKCQCADAILLNIAGMDGYHPAWAVETKPPVILEPEQVHCPP